MERLYSYKMSHDNRFAPNPLFGVLTLATCKPQLRKNAKVGDWIAGWTSSHIAHTPTPCRGRKADISCQGVRKIDLCRVLGEIPC